MLDVHEKMTLEGDKSTPAGDRHRKAVVDFFNGRFSWWQNVYGDNLPRGFFSYEMNRRKSLVIEAVTSHLNSGTNLKILECGCGPGGILRDLPVTGHDIFGTDINRNYLAEMLRACPRATGICCDLQNMAFPDSQFDVVICVGVLPYLRQDEAAIAEMSRMLKPGGLLVISNPNYYMIDKFFDPYYYFIWPLRQVRRLSHRFMRRRRSAADGFSSDRIRRYRFGELDPLYKNYDLQIVQDMPVSYGPLRFWKKECFRIEHAIRLSDLLVRLASRKPLRFLQRLANHRVTCLKKLADQVMVTA